jgi:N-acetylmuramic acid 6-phosphate etherase
MNSLSLTISQEQNTETTNLSALSLSAMLALLNKHDALVPLAIQAVLPQVEEAVQLIVARLRYGGRLFYVGAGTSGRLGVLDSVECPPTFGTSPDMVQAIIAGGLDAMLRAVENVEDDRSAAVTELQSRKLNAEDVVIGIAASGRTPFVIAALEYAQQTGAGTIAITTRGCGEISQKAEIIIAPDVGPEVLSGSTRMKSGSAQKMLLGMISTAVMTQLGKVYGNFMIDVKASNKKLLQRAEYIVCQLCGVDKEISRKILISVEYNVRAAVLRHMLKLTPEAAKKISAQPFVMLNDQLNAGSNYGS